MDYLTFSMLISIDFFLVKVFLIRFIVKETKKIIEISIARNIKAARYPDPFPNN
jgi:hypothetical protein